MPELSINELIDLVLAANNSDPSSRFKPSFSVDQDKMADFLKLCDFFRRFTEEPENLFINADIEHGNASINLDLSELEISGNALSRLHQSLSGAVQISISSSCGGDRFLLSITFPDLFKKT